MRHKLGVIVPFRDRHEQLELFTKSIEYVLNDKKIPYEIIIVEQDDAKLFNRGMILNIGYTYAKKMGCDYVVFHDVDMLPIKVDYGYSSVPIHLSTEFISDNEDSKRDIFMEYFGGVTLFPSKLFEKINGYSNKYWGWGFEDDDLLHRCKLNGIPLDKIELNNNSHKGKFVVFNGVDSYVKCENTIDLNISGTIIINFDVENFILNHNKLSDEFTAFSIPGWNFAISYTSFSRYNFCAFDYYKKPYFINTEIVPKHSCTIAITFDRIENKFRMYKDGEYVGETDEYQRIYPYKKEKFFYLGVGNPNNTESPNFLNGSFLSFAYYDEILTQEDISEISNVNSIYKGLHETIQPKIYYNSNHISDDYKLLDLVGDNHGEIVKCEIVEKDKEKNKIIEVPFRRNGLFKSLHHEENGFSGEGWKDINTRWNQLRYHNEVCLNDDLILNDGLSDLQFHEWGKTQEGKILKVNVGI